MTHPNSVNEQATQLSPRQQAMLRLLGSGLSLSESAARLEISRSTANSHRARLMERLELNDRAELIAFAKQWMSSLNAEPTGVVDDSEPDEVEDLVSARVIGGGGAVAPAPVFSSTQLVEVP